MNTKAVHFLFGLIATEVCIISGQLSLIQTLQNARTAEEFLQHVMINGRPARLSDVYMDTSTTDENGEQVYVSGGLTLARPDECSPRLTTVTIPRGPGDHNVVYWPKCTQIERCGGCCVSNMLKCFPTRIETVELHVLKTTLPFPGALNLEWEGPMPVVLERHVACSPICRTTREDCTASQTFNEMECMCRCNHQSPCFPLQTWDEATCSCKCRTVLNCSPSTFNTETCECEINRGSNDIRYSSDNGDITAEETANFDNDNAQPSTTQKPTTTTTTQQFYDPCLTLACPPRFGKRVAPSNPNECRCVPPFFYPGRK
ncbi:uncharacterized protein LOC121375458 [Gigantopelta aegis]|uniref:uncharacterized protein LOC121375458 n=1 Tax=Gigantopelta aegis TaxID=1735272 RepID=UPI001B88B314|nr:uncharacterized protein LOC121375458 [Gigantopelta aegis]